MNQETKMVDRQMQVTLSGSIYVDDAKEMRELLNGCMDKGQNSFLIDLSQVEYIDSTGLGMLVSIHKRASQSGGMLRLSGIQGIVKEIFELTRLNTVFEIQE